MKGVRTISYYSFFVVFPESIFLSRNSLSRHMIWGDSLIATDRFSVVAKEFFVFTAIKDSGSTSKEATTGHNSPLYMHFFFCLAE